MNFFHKKIILVLIIFLQLSVHSQQLSEIPSIDNDLYTAYFLEDKRCFVFLDSTFDINTPKYICSLIELAYKLKKDSSNYDIYEFIIKYSCSETNSSNIGIYKIGSKYYRDYTIPKSIKLKKVCPR